MKKKMSLKELEVASFLTTTKRKDTSKIGGSYYTVWCPSDWTECDPTDLC